MNILIKNLMSVFWSKNKMQYSFDYPGAKNKLSVTGAYIFQWYVNTSHATSGLHRYSAGHTYKYESTAEWTTGDCYVSGGFATFF